MDSSVEGDVLRDGSRDSAGSYVRSTVAFRSRFRRRSVVDDDDLLGNAVFIELLPVWCLLSTPFPGNRRRGSCRAGDGTRGPHIGAVSLGLWLV